MKTKTIIRVVVFAAIFAWPAVESYRYYVARQQLADSQEREKKVTQQVASLKAKSAQLAKNAAPATK